jgi:hypothetical protein
LLEDDDGNAAATNVDLLLAYITELRTDRRGLVQIIKCGFNGDCPE